MEGSSEIGYCSLSRFLRRDDGRCYTCRIWPMTLMTSILQRSDLVVTTVSSDREMSVLGASFVTCKITTISRPSKVDESVLNGSW